MRRKTISNLVGAAILSSAAAAFALAIIDVWIDDNVYVDSTENVIIDPTLVQVGSSSENEVLRLRITSRSGSSTEKYVSDFQPDAELPAASKVFHATSRWEPSGRSVGELSLETANREVISGEFLDSPINAEAEPIGSDTE
jgi:hypothetical protein